MGSDLDAKRDILATVAPSETDPAFRIYQSDLTQVYPLMEVVKADGTVVTILGPGGELLGVVTGGGGLSESDVLDVMIENLGAGAVTGSPDLSTRVDELEAKPVRTVTGTSTMLSDDAGGIVLVDSASAAVFLLPDDSVPVTPGASVKVVWWGVGAVSFGPAVGGVAINGLGGIVTIVGRYGVVEATKVASNSWLLDGALGTVPITPPPPPAGNTMGYPPFISTV
jgi:hypothetical protein